MQLAQALQKLSSMLMEAVWVIQVTCIEPEPEVQAPLRSLQTIFHFMSGIRPLSPSLYDSLNPDCLGLTLLLHRQVTKALFFRPANTRGPAPNTKDSIISALTYSKLNFLLVCNPIVCRLSRCPLRPRQMFSALLRAGVCIMPTPTFMQHSFCLYLELFH